MADQPVEQIESTSPTIDVWATDGKVALAVENCQILEGEDGRMVPGLGLPPIAAIELAEVLLRTARKVVEEDDDEEEDE